MSKPNDKRKSNGKGGNADSRGKVVLSEDERKIIDPILSQTPPVVELPVAVLKIDWEYQTRPRKRIFDDITNNLKEGALGVLFVCERLDGSIYIGDGVTRVLAIIARGEKQRLMRCLKYKVDGGQKVEALLFAWWNSNKSKEPIRLETYYQARYVAGVDGGFGKLIEHCGFKLNASSGQQLLRGIGWVRKAFDLDNGISLEKALFAVKTEWLPKKHKLFGFMVLGIAMIYYDWVGRSIDEQVRRKLEQHSPDDIWQEVVASMIKKGGKSTKASIRPDEKPGLITGTITSMINTRPGKAEKIHQKFSDRRMGA